MFKKDKRQFLRLSAHHLLKYKLLDEGGKEGTLSFVRNISAGGVLFHSNEYIKPGSNLGLDISFPPSSDSVKIKAKVLRTGKLKTVGGFDVAVQFLNLNGDIKKIIDRKIENTAYKTKEDDMKTLAAIFIIFAAIAGIIALSTRFNLIPVIFFKAATWLNIVNTSLLFSIAISLVKSKTNS
ncbi:MAG: PilZ domain-containing protein [Candidatus Omnitrophica bacterium]|nr:PilZ domain-containing protein [Candidatus Omnitrophota bacterium]